MSARKFRIHDGKRGAALAIRVTPRAKRNEVSEILEDGTIKIRITAPPVEGKANRALIEFLAEILDVPGSQIEIVAGDTGRDKLVSVFNMDAETVGRRIAERLEA
jgi:hypothetical protein